MPILLGVYMMTAATGTMGGEDDNGTLELVVAMPLPRWQIVMMKAIALIVVSFVRPPDWRLVNAFRSRGSSDDGSGCDGRTACVAAYWLRGRSWWLSW